MHNTHKLRIKMPLRDHSKKQTFVLQHSLYFCNQFPNYTNTIRFTSANYSTIDESVCSEVTSVKHSKRNSLCLVEMQHDLHDAQATYTCHMLFIGEVKVVHFLLKRL